MRLQSIVLSSVCLLALSGQMAQAKVPADVMQSYKAYNAAMSAQDYQTALREGKAAWKRAEKSMGDSKTTGDLAFNYGFLEQARGTPKSAVKALTRAADLAQGAETRMEREVELVKTLEKTGADDKAQNRSQIAQRFAVKNGLNRSVFMGELLVHDTNACNRRASRSAKKSLPSPSGRTGSRVSVKKSPEEYTARIQAECSKMAQTALDIFNANPGTAQAKYVATAANSVGYGHERKKDFLAAALSYQTAREAIEKTMGRQNALVAHTIGRWVNARARIAFDGKLDQAMAAGLCDCWPYKTDTPKVAVLDTGKADNTRLTLKNQYGSGYAILQADVSDAGQPTNIRVLDSWPSDAYVKESRAKLEGYSFAPKSGSEPADYRKDVTVPFTYTVYDRESQDVY